MTGATGLVGGEIVRYFLEQGYDVIGTSSSAFKSVCPRLTIVRFRLEAIEAAELRAGLAGCTALVHAAAVMPHSGDINDPDFARRMFQANIAGTFGLLQTAAAAGVPHAILIGRTAGYREVLGKEVREDSPPFTGDVYALSKLVCEEVATYFDRVGGIKTAVLRISAPYGPGYRVRSIVSTFVERALAGDDLELWGTGARLQTFTYVRDIARACGLAIGEGASGPYNIAGPRAVSMRELAETVVRVVGPARSRVVFSNRRDPNEDERTRVSIDRAAALLGYEPTFDLEAGIRDFVRILRRPRPPLWSPQPT